MKEKVAQVVAAVVLGFVFSSGVMIIEESSSTKSIAGDKNNTHIQIMDRLNAEPDAPPPPPPPPPGGGGLTK